MDLASLISALGASEKAAAESNPFSPLQSASEGIGAALLQNAGNFSTSENLIGGLLTGLVSGFTDNLANNYQSKQSAMASQLLEQALSGQSVFEKPEDMNQSVFDVTKKQADTLSLFDSLQAREAERKANLATEQAVKQATALAPIAIGTELAKQRGLLGEQRKLDPLAGLPDSTRKQYADQTQQAAQNQNTQIVVDDLFEQANKLPSLGVLNPMSGTSEQFQNIRIALIEAAQKLRGPEFNEPFRRELEKTLPDWNDTPAIIKIKKEGYQKLLQGMTPVTPLVSGSIAMPKDNQITTGGGISRDAAMAELKRRGLVK